MVLVISNNNSVVKIILKYIDKENTILEDKTEDINIYVDKELMSKKIDLFDRIIIDINSLKNSNEEIIKAILRLKVIYDIQIIILAIGYKVGNGLLSDLFNIGVYDFIISEDNSFQDEEFRKAIIGNNYIDSVKFKNENKPKKKLRKIKIRKKKFKDDNKKNEQAKKILACFSFLKNIIFEVIKVISYILLMFLISVGATALINSNIREILIQIIGGI